MKDKVIFVAKHDGLELVPELKPYPSAKHMPSWYKKVPRIFKGQQPFEPGGTVRRCPSYKDWFSNGYIVPNWCETILANNGINWRWTTSVDDFVWDFHDNTQFVDWIPKEAGVNAVYKAICPWDIITPPGWSILQLPVYYDYNTDWEVLPGVIHTDVHHEVNPQVALYGDKELINIKSGVPFFRIVPFERKKLDFEVYGKGQAPKKLLEDIRRRHLRLMTSFRGNYRKIIKLEDYK